MRTLLQITMLFALFAVGCQPSNDNSITLWHQMQPADRVILKQQVEKFQRLNPGVEVRVLYKETEELRSGLESAVLVGQGPDIVYGPSDTLGVYQAIGAIQDLSPWFSEETIEQFDPRSIITLPNKNIPDKNELVFVGDRFGNHVALVVNRNLVKKVPTTTDELIEVAIANTIDENQDGKPERYGLVWNYTEPFFAVPFITGHGAWVFEESKKSADERPKPSLNTPEMVAALEFIADLRTKHKVLPRSADYDAASALFQSGKAAMILDGDWSWGNYLANKKINAEVVVLPTVSSTGIPMGPMVAPKGYSMSVAATGDRAPLAAKLIVFLTNEETQRLFLTKQRVIPSRLALQSAPEMTSDLTLVASAKQIENGVPMPTALELRAVWDAMRPPYQQLMAGSITPQEAAEEMQRIAIERIEILTSSTKPDATAPLVVFIGVVISLVILFYFCRTVKRIMGDLAQNRFAYLMVMPSIVLVFLTVLFPLVYNVVLSFSNMSLSNFHDWEIVGLHNYQSLFTGGNSAEFWGVFLKTIVWTVVNVTLHVTIGVLLAVTLNGPVRGKSFYRIVLIIPWAVPAYITALTWRGMFDYEFGAVNHVISSIGWLNSYLPEALHILPVDWLKRENPAFAACIIANVWLGFPFMMVIALGGLQGIPRELYEAATIDRASRWQQFRHVTLPMLMPVLVPAITLGAVWTFNNLNVVWLVSNGGEPADKTHILVSYVYKAVFNLYQYGYGAALSMIIFFMLVSFSIVFLRGTNATSGTR